MIIGERDLVAEIAEIKANCEAHQARVLASVVGGSPEWSGPIVNGVRLVGDAFMFDEGVEMETITFEVNPLVILAADATEVVLIGAVPSGSLTLDPLGNLVITFTEPQVIRDGDFECIVPAGEFSTLGGQLNEEFTVTVPFYVEGAPA